MLFLSKPDLEHGLIYVERLFSEASLFATALRDNDASMIADAYAHAKHLTQPRSPLRDFRVFRACTWERSAHTKPIIWIGMFVIGTLVTENHFGGMAIAMLPTALVALRDVRRTHVCRNVLQGYCDYVEARLPEATQQGRELLKTMRPA